MFNIFFTHRFTLPTATVIILAVLTIFSAPSAHAFTGAGAGTGGDPFQITTCAHLQEMNDAKDKAYKLMNNVDCSATTGWNAGAGFAPIGSAGAMFTGSLNGNSFYISGLFISRAGSTYVGLFSWIDTGGSVTDLGLVSANITGASFTGAVVSALKGTLTRVYATGSVAGTTYAGGVVGYNVSGTATLSYANVAVTGSGNYAGGFLGYGEGGTISNSYALSTVVTSASYAGGFAGYNFLGTLTNTFAAGSVTATNKGGLVALNQGTITSSYYDSQTTGASDTGKGTSKTTAQMMTQSTFTDWTFTVAGNGTIGDWIMAGYPHLQMEHRTAITSVTELQLMAVNLGGAYTISNDLTFPSSTKTLWNGGSGFAPIGSSGAKFTGSLNGAGKKITGLYISRIAENNIGLLGYTNGATLQNIGLESASITGLSSTGGLIGYQEGGSISKSYTTGSISGGETGQLGQGVGGLVGYVNNAGAISNSYSTSSVSGNRVGGILGDGGILDNPTITNCYATGSISGQNKGGVVGLGITVQISNSYYDSTTTTVSTPDDATKKTTAEMKTQSTFNGWTFTVAGNGTIGDWIMAGYPHLQMEHRTAITSAVELQLMAVNLDGDYTISNNLDATAVTNYVPMGTLAVPFTGSLDGNGYLITNLVINQPSLQSAGIIGSTDATVTITEVGYRSGSVTGDRFVGAIVGYNRGAITKSFANVNVTAVTVTPSNPAVGGLVGVNSASAISDSYATGNVSSTFDVGGLIGYNSGTVSRTYATGGVSGGTNMGGLVGRAELATISNSFATGSIGTGATSSGGFLGALGGGVTISGGYWNSTGSPANCYQGGNTGCTAVNNSLSYFYTVSFAPMTAWNFETTWLNTSISFPTLLAFGDLTAPVILNVNSDTPNNGYSGNAVIDIDVTFSEAVTSTGNVTVTLETGEIDRTCTFTVSNSAAGTCDYVVQTGEYSNDLTVSSITGTIADQAGNAMTNFTPSINLAVNKEIIILVGGKRRRVEPPAEVVPSVTAEASAVSPESASSPASPPVSSSGSSSSSSIRDTVREVPAIQEPTPEKPAAKKASRIFNDVQHHWAEEYVNKLHDKCGVMGYRDEKGNPLGLFGPEKLITRAELVKMMVGCWYEEVPEIRFKLFKDVESSAWYSSSLFIAKKEGWISGYPDSTFKPDVLVKREEALKILVLSRYADSDLKASASSFGDVVKDSWYAKYIDFALSRKIISGYSDPSGNTTGTFGVEKNMTRAEAAKIIVNVMGW